MAATEYSPRARAERVIASGRAFLVLFALAGVVFAPTDSETFAVEAMQLLWLYGAYSIAVWFAVSRGALVTRRATNAQHSIDLLVAVILTMMTRGSGSPFFLFFTFMLLAATVRWQAWGALSTGLVVVVAYLAVVAYEMSRGSGTIDTNRFIVRLGLLVVMTMVLGRLGAYQQRIYSELHQLAAWPRAAGTELNQILRESLEYASRVLSAPTAILIWQDEDDSQTALAIYRDGQLERATAPIAVNELVLVPHDVRRFLHVRRSSGLRTIASSDRTRELSSPVLSGDLVEQYGVQTLVAAALPERSHHGWLLLVNSPAGRLSTDDLLLAEIVAADVSASVEHWSLSQRARDAAVAEERLRVSRDLHDGVLQSLTGCRLNIAAVAVSAEGASTEIAAQLRALERALAHEQQELREVIQALRGVGAPRPPTPLRDLCARVERQWRVLVTLTPNADTMVPAELNGPTLLMVHEALANAVRHGKARNARVAVERRGEVLVIRIEDDGQGFSFRGRMHGPELAARKTGPRSLRERAETLGGTLAVTSRDTGSIIEIAIPVTRESICA